MIKLNLLESPEAERLRKRCEKFLIIGVPHDTEFGFLGYLIDLRKIVPYGDGHNYIGLVEPCLELPRVVKMLKEIQPGLVLLSTAFDHGIFYRIREAIGDEVLLVAFSTFGVSEEQRVVLMEYADGIIERSGLEALCLRRDKC